MAESSDPQGTIDTTQFRRAGIVAFIYAVVDFLIVLGAGFFMPLRLIGIVVAFFVIKDILVLRDAGLEWGWTRYLVLTVVAVGGFLGFFFYAWRRHTHLESHSWPDPEEDDAVKPADGKSQEPADGDTEAVVGGTDTATTDDGTSVGGDQSGAESNDVAE